MSQAERDRLEEERIARVRATREALLSGRTTTDGTEVLSDLKFVALLC